MDGDESDVDSEVEACGRMVSASVLKNDGVK